MKDKRKRVTELPDELQFVQLTVFYIWLFGGMLLAIVVRNDDLGHLILVVATVALLLWMWKFACHVGSTYIFIDPEAVEDGQ